MADRTVNTKLKMDSRDYVRSAERAGDATDKLRNKAERFSGKKYEASVGVDGSARAYAEVARLEQKLEKMERTYRARVNMETKGAQRDVQLIMNSISALGPAAIAAAGVATGALLGLGATVGTVGAGLGVLVGGLWGVGDALKAMGDNERAAAENSAAAASQRRSSSRAIEAAINDVSRAEKEQGRVSVQNSEASAAAARRVEDAEQDLAVAHQRVTYALEDLHGARQQAIRDLEDMRERSDDLALDEREAVVRLADARDDLTKAESNSATSARDLEKARIDVARAEDRLSDVQRDRKRNSADLAAADRAGVEGMPGVLSAKRSLADAERGVNAAQQDLIDAQADVARTQRENAQRTEDAALRVQEAQRRLTDVVADATEAMSEQSTEAKKLQETLDALSPAGQRFVDFLYSLRPQVKELQALAQAGMLPGFEDGISDLITIMPDVEDLVKKVSAAVGEVGREGGKAFSDPFWQDYIHFIAEQATPTLTGFFRIGEKLARGVANLQIAFNPMAKDVIAGLEDMADRFARWSGSLDGSDKFASFIAYVEDIGPDVWETITSIAGALTDIVVAAAPLAGPTLAVIRALADALGFIASIPGVGTTLLATATAMGMLNLAIRTIEVTKFSRLGQFIGGLPDMMNKAGDKAGLFALQLGASGEAAQRVADRTSRVTRMLSNIGPIAAGAAGAIALVGWQYEINRSRADEFADAVANGTSTMADAVAKQEELIRGRSAIGHLFSGTSDLFDDKGINQAKLHAQAIQDVTNALMAQQRAIDPVQRATANAVLAQIDYNREVQNFGSTSPQAVGALGRYEAATRDVEIAQIMSRDKVDRMTASVIYQNQVLTGAVSANNQADRAMLTFDQTNARATETLREHSRTSIEGRDAILSVKEAAVSAATAAGEKAKKDAEASGASDGAARAAQAQKDTYLELAKKTNDPLRSELIQLADRVSTLPDGNFTVTGSGKVDLPQWKAPDGSLWTIDPNGVTSTRVGGLATGGMVDSVLPGYSPGVDNHLFYSPTAGFLGLSGGEGILRPEATRAIGGPSGLESINRAARQGGAKGVSKLFGQAFADGGVFMTGTPMPDIAMQLHGGISKSIIAATKPYIAERTRQLEEAAKAGMGGGDILAFARQMAGRPYVWGASGPGGFDCSGFVSALVNVARGIAPPFRRVGTTASFPWPGFQPGLGPGLQVGAFKGNPGHMAATVGGVNMESAGGVGVRVGPGARGAADPMFNIKATLPLTAAGGALAGAVGGGASRWAGTVAEALRMLGLPASLTATTLRRMQQESGGNPRAINNWDSNAKRGTPSKGLMQVIDPTFAANWDPRTPYDIWNPLSNIVASMKYAIRRYGSLSAAYDRPGGYMDGGVIPGARSSRDDRFLLAQAGERVLTRAQNRAFEEMVAAIATPRRVAFAPAPAGGTADGGARTVTINNENHFESAVDVDLFNQRTEFAIGGAGL